MNKLRLRNNWLKFKTLGKLLINLEKIMKHISIESRKTDRSQHVNQIQYAQESPWTLSWSTSEKTNRITPAPHIP